MANPWATTSGSTLNLTSVSINPDVPPVATAREGGFTLRNRIKWSSVNSSANVTGDGSANANIMRLLEVPKRTIIRKLSFHAVPGSSAATHAYSGSTAGSASMDVGASMWKTASQSSTKSSANAFNSGLSVTNSTGAISSAFGTVSASTPWTQAVHINGGSQNSGNTVPFPFGGYVIMNLAGGASASSASSAKMSGVMEIRAICDYMPE